MPEPKTPTAADIAKLHTRASSDLHRAIIGDMQGSTTPPKTEEPPAPKTAEPPKTEEPQKKQDENPQKTQNLDPSAISDADLEAAKKSGASPKLVEQLQKVAQENKDLRAKLAEQEEAAKSAVDPAALEKITQERDELDARLRKVAYRFHPEYVEQVEKPIQEAAKSFVGMLSNCGLTKDEIIRATQLLDAPPNVQRYTELDKLTEKLPRSIQNILTTKVMEMDTLYAKAHATSQLDPTQLKEYMGELDRSSAARGTPEKVQREAAVKVLFADPNYIQFHQKEIVGLTGEALTAAKTHNAEVLQTRALATRLAQGQATPGEYADFVAKATAHSTLEKALAVAQAQLTAKDKEITDMKKAVPGVKPGGTIIQTGNKTYKETPKLAPIDFVKSLLS